MMELPILVVFALTVFLTKLGHDMESSMMSLCLNIVPWVKLFWGILHRGPSFFLANKYKNKISLIQTA